MLLQGVWLKYNGNHRLVMAPGLANTRDTMNITTHAYSWIIEISTRASHSWTSLLLSLVCIRGDIHYIHSYWHILVPSLVCNFHYTFARLLVTTHYCLKFVNLLSKTSYWNFLFKSRISANWQKFRENVWEIISELYWNGHFSTVVQ